MARFSLRPSLACLTKKRLIVLVRNLGLSVAAAEPKETLVDALVSSKETSLEDLLARLPLADSRSICAGHELPASGTKASDAADDNTAPKPTPVRALGTVAP